MVPEPGSELPDLPQGQYISSKEHMEHKKPNVGERCSTCGLLARNKVEQDDHIKHDHGQEDPKNTDKIILTSKK